MADSNDFWGDFAKRFGNERTPRDFSNFGQQDNLFTRLREAPAWKVVILGSAGAMTLGAVFTGLLLAAGALMLLLTLFGFLLGGPSKENTLTPFPMDSPPTFH